MFSKKFFIKIQYFTHSISAAKMYETATTFQIVCEL